MARWISMELAQQTGICANFSFLFPNVFIHELFNRVIGSYFFENSVFTPEILTWKIMESLYYLIDNPEFENLRLYFGEKNGAHLIDQNLKLYKLAEKIADLFDQYLLYRPEMIFKWEQEKDEHWQAILWRKLVADNGKNHRAYAGKKFISAIQDPYFNPEDLPERISIFGISTLPPFYFEIIYTFSQFCKVNFFLINPCLQYWGEILSNNEIRKIQKQKVHIEENELYLEQGNSLLASMGIVGREFTRLILGYDEINEISSSHKPDDDIILSCIQSDILNFVERGVDFKKKVICKNDDSIQIHSCHSPMREVEVLYDRLLDMFEKDSSLSPDEILVMTPDIETYAPYIHAVFDMPADNKNKIPFSVADKNVRLESATIEAFLSIIELANSRYAPSLLFAILESKAVKEHFDLSDKDMEIIYRWIKDTGIRWGIDSRHKKDFDLPDSMENTWRTGLDRLILGYALTGDDLFEHILPYESISGSTAYILENFLNFTDKVFDLLEKFKEKYTLHDWAVIFKQILKDFFKIKEDAEHEFQVLRDLIDSFDKIESISSYKQKVDINIIKAFLNQRLSRKGFDSEFLTGGVTFCLSLPMRSIPFKIICFLGLNNETFPRQDNNVGFNLIAKAKKRTDRSKRNDDRYLFLEAIVSARQKLYISYIGQSIIDNRPLPPSVLVSELMDYIKQGFEHPEEADICNHIITKHRVASFYPDYFNVDNSKKLFTYNKSNLYAARTLLSKKEKKNKVFITKGIPSLKDDRKIISIYELKKFFSNPAKYFLNKRLSVYLEIYGNQLQETEAFEIKGLEKYKLEDSLVQKKFENKSIKEMYDWSRASGLLPHGVAGECIYFDMNRRVEKFVKKVSANINSSQHKHIEIGIETNGVKFFGHIKPVYSKGIIKYRHAKIRPIDILKLWIDHLLLNIAEPALYGKSVLIGLDLKNIDKIITISFSSNFSENSPYSILSDLTELFFKGLEKPLHFFPLSSYTYAESIVRKAMPLGKAFNNALKAWKSTEFMKKESKELHYDFCFSCVNPLNAEFKEVALKVFLPILEQLSGN